MNLAGVERVFDLEEQLDRMQRKVGVLERRAEQLLEEIARLEEKRESVKAEIVQLRGRAGHRAHPGPARVKRLGASAGSAAPRRSAAAPRRPGPGPG